VSPHRFEQPRGSSRRDFVVEIPKKVFLNSRRRSHSAGMPHLSKIAVDSALRIDCALGAKVRLPEAALWPAFRPCTSPIGVVLNGAEPLVVKARQTPTARFNWRLSHSGQCNITTKFFKGRVPKGARHLHHVLRGVGFRRS
jgi:hypothetical protein